MEVPKSMTRLMATLATVMVCLAYGQNVSDQPDASIRQLIDGVQQAAINGSPVDQFFTPSIRANQKSQIDHLQTQGFLTFQIADYTLKDLRLEDAQHASLPVTVKWSTRGEEASKTTTLRFVREQDKWYFAQADFWEVSVLWFFFPMIAIAIGYGCSAVLMMRHSSRQQWVNPRKKILWQALSIVPALPFFYFSRKPWTSP